MPASSNVINSPASTTPLVLASRQTLTCDHAASDASNFPLPLESKSFNASNPLDAVFPDDKTVWLPNISAPLSIFPLLFKSRTKNPSFLPIQPLFSIFWLLSKSKNTLPFVLTVSIFPSPFKSTTKGERVISASPNKAEIVLFSASGNDGDS